MARNDKKKEHVFEKKVKPKKETILVEVIDNYNEILSAKPDTYKGYPVIEYVKQYGKLYAKCKNERV